MTKYVVVAVYPDGDREAVIDAVDTREEAERRAKEAEELRLREEAERAEAKRRENEERTRLAAIEADPVEDIEDLVFEFSDRFAVERPARRDIHVPGAAVALFHGEAEEALVAL